VARELPVLIVVSGGSVLALWLYVRLGGRRPRSMQGAIVHALLALAALGSVPLVMELFLGRGRSHNEEVVGLLVILLPAITYAFLATLYVFEHLQRRLYAR
jgi:uncharacterized membrane protein